MNLLVAVIIISMLNNKIIYRTSYKFSNNNNINSNSKIMISNNLNS